MKTLLAALSFLVLSVPLFAAPKQDIPLFHLKPTDTLYIQFSDMIDLRRVGENDRFYHFKSTMEEVLQETGLPMNYRIVRFGANAAPPGQPRLLVTLTKWGDNGMSEIEVRFSASLRYDFDRAKLGMFYYRGGSSYATSEQLTRTYNDILRKALVKMVSELNARVEFGDSFRGGPLPGAQEDSNEGGQTN